MRTSKEGEGVVGSKKRLQLNQVCFQVSVISCK